MGTLEPLLEGAESASVDDLRGQLYDATRQALAAAQNQGPDHVVHARELSRS